MDNELATARVRSLVRMAKALGIAQWEDITDLERKVAQKKAALDSGSWEERMKGYAARRRRLAGAYIAGASLKQLAQLMGVSAPTIQTLVARELPDDDALKAQLKRRVGRGQKLPTSLVATMLATVSEEEASTKSTTEIANIMAVAGFKARENERRDAGNRREGDEETGGVGDSQNSLGGGERKGP